MFLALVQSNHVTSDPMKSDSLGLPMCPHMCEHTQTHTPIIINLKITYCVESGLAENNTKAEKSFERLSRTHMLAIKLEWKS